MRFLLPDRIWDVSSSDCVYLTFDDGPTDQLTAWIVDLLQEHDVKATFFLVGENAKMHPELVQLIRDKGHVLGNHTMRHELGTKVSAKEYLASIDEASKYIESSLFRPPYGRLPLLLGAKVKKSYKIVMWSWLSYDFDCRVEVSEILKKAKRQVSAGDVLVLHDNLKTKERLKEILPSLIKIVKAKGLKFDVISA